MVPGSGKLEIKFTPDDGSDPMQYTVFQFENSGGVALSMYNTDEVCSIQMIPCLFCTWYL